MANDPGKSEPMSALLSSALLLAFVLLLSAFAAAPFLAVTPLQEEIAAKANLLRLYRAKAQTLDGSQKTAMTPTAAQRTFLRAPTDGIAGAQLQQHILEIASRLGLEVQSTQSLQPVGGDGLTKIAVRLELTGSIAHLQALLHGIETSEPILFVEQLSVSAAPARNNRTSIDADNAAEDTGSSHTEAIPLQIGLTVLGYLDEEQSS